MKFEEIYEQIKDIGGWMGKEDCLVLYNYAKKVKHGLIVEIGSFTGRSVKVMALASPSSKIVAIDPYFKNRPFAYPFEKANSEEIMNQFLKTTRELNVELIRKPSQLAGKTWNKKIDLLHIDGDHRYKSVKQDIRLFIPHVKKGHYILVHDYVVMGGEPKIEVKRAVDDSTKYFKDIKQEGGFACCRV